MINSVIIKVLTHRLVAPTALRCVIKIQNNLYYLTGILAIAVNNGEHPKHRLLRYQDWFADHIESTWVVLDIGSNTGSMTARLAMKACYVYGIEISSSLSEISRQNYSGDNLEFITADAVNYEYSNFRKIDCITLSNVLEHIRDRPVFLQRLMNNLPWNDRSKCLFLIRVPTIERDWVSLYKKELGIEYRLDRTHEIEYTRSEFLNEMEVAGLDILEMSIHCGEIYAVCSGKF